MKKVPRMINTPWFEEPVPFQEAAEMGTRKVIQEHSTLGIVMTSDGSIADIPREAYVEVEERIVIGTERGWKAFYSLTELCSSRERVCSRASC